MTQTISNFRNAPVPYLNATNTLQKKPVCYCVFGLVTGPLGTNSQVLPDQYTTGPIKGATQSRKRIMTFPIQTPNALNVVTSQTTISSLSFRLMNVDGEATRIVTNYIMKNRKVTIYAGYEDIDQSSYAPRYVGQINNWTRSSDGTYYEFQVTDALKQLKASVLYGHTQLTKDFNPTTKAKDDQGKDIAHTPDTTIGVTSLYGMAPSTDANDGQGSRSYVRIDDSLYSYTNIGLIQDGTVYWKWLNNVPQPIPANLSAWLTSKAYLVNDVVYANGQVYRCLVAGTSASSGVGPFNTGTQTIEGLKLVQLNSNGLVNDVIHQAGATVDNYVLYEGNPIDIILRIVLSTGAGTNYSGTGTNYDVYPTSQGVGVPYSLVNISSFESQKNKFTSNMLFGNYFTEEAEALTFIQENILRQVNAYLFVNGDGQLDINLYYVPYGTLDAITLDINNIKGTPQFDANLQTGNNFYNEIDIKYDYQPVADFFVNERLIEDLGSQQKFEERYSLPIESKMIRTIHGGLGVAQRMGDIYLSRFSVPPPVITCQAFYQVHLLNVGDLVYLNHPSVPNYVTGLDGGGPILCQAISVATDFSHGFVDIKLLGIGFVNTNRYASIAPNSATSSFSLATANEKLADVYLCSDSGVMPDLSQPYLVSP